METQNSFGRDGLKTAISHAQGHDGYVGGWQNEENTDYYFDSVRIFPEGSLEQAIDFGVMNNQLAIYVISQDSTIYMTNRK